MLDATTGRLTHDARLTFDRSWPGTLAKHLVYCAAGVRTEDELYAALKTMHKLDQIPWPFDDCIVVGEIPFGFGIKNNASSLVLFQRIFHKHDDRDHVRVVLASLDGGHVHCDADVGMFVHTRAPNWASPDLQEWEKRVLPDDGLAWQMGLLRMATPDKKKIHCDFALANVLLSALVNLAAPCGHRVRVTDLKGFGTKKQRRITRGQKHIMWVNWDRLNTVAKECNHPMAERRRPERIRAHPKYQWKRDAGFYCYEAPSDPHQRQMLALELGVGYVWCPEHIEGDGVMETPTYKLELLTEPIEVKPRRKKKRAG